MGGGELQQVCFCSGGSGSTVEVTDVHIYSAQLVLNASCLVMQKIIIAFIEKLINNDYYPT